MTSAILPAHDPKAFLASLSDQAVIDYLEACRDDCRFILEERANRKRMSRRTVDFCELVGKDPDATLKDSRTVRLFLEIAQVYDSELSRRGLPIPEWLDEAEARDFGKISEDFDAFTMPMFSEADEVHLQGLGVRL